MTPRTFDVVLQKRSAGVWTTQGLEIPSARVTAVTDGRGTSIPFAMGDGTIEVGTDGTLFARVEVSEDLVRKSALEEAKLDLEREKVASAERLERRTLWVSVATAIVSAMATIAVAAIPNLFSKPSTAPTTSFKDLHECREALNNLKTLAVLERQTLPDLQMAVRRQVDLCSERLKAALDAAPS